MEFKPQDQFQQYCVDSFKNAQIEREAIKTINLRQNGTIASNQERSIQNQKSISLLAGKISVWIIIIPIIITTLLSILFKFIH